MAIMAIPNKRTAAYFLLSGYIKHLRDNRLVGSGACDMMQASLDDLKMDDTASPRTKACDGNDGCPRCVAAYESGIRKCPKLVELEQRIEDLERVAMEK